LLLRSLLPNRTLLPFTRRSPSSPGCQPRSKRKRCPLRSMRQRIRGPSNRGVSVIKRGTPPVCPFHGLPDLFLTPVTAEDDSPPLFPFRGRDDRFTASSIRRRNSLAASK